MHIIVGIIGAILSVAATAAISIGTYTVDNSVDTVNSPQTFGASVFTVRQGGTGTSTITRGHLISGAGIDAFDSVATTSASCSGNASCAPFTVIGTSPVTISASGGGGSGTVSTSTNETAGRLSYWTSTAGTPALLGEVATTTLTATSPLSLSQTVVKVGGSNSVLTIATTTNSLFSGTGGNILAYSNALGGYFPQATSTMNVGTATALAANGANCSAGSYPLGVDASGAVESCTADAIVTAGDALTLTGTDIDFDGGTAPGGELGGTWASPTIDDSLAVASWNLTSPTFTTNITFDAETFDSLTDDATLANNSGDLQVVDVTCTDCLNATEIEDIYLLNTTDTSSGAYTWTGLHTFSNSTTSLASFGYASSTVWRGGGLLTDCDSDAQALGWDLTTGQFTCGDDDSGVGGGITTIKEDDSDVVVAATAIDFGVGFDVAAVVTEGNISLDLLEYNGAASTTLLSANYASSTLFFGAGLSACGSNSWLSWASGVFGCGSLVTSGDWTGTLDGFEGADLDSVALDSEVTGDLPFSNLTQGAANTVLANVTGATADFAALATSSLFAATNGQVLVRSNGTWVGGATTTFSGGLLYAAGNVTNTLTAGDGLTRTVDDFDCDTASGSVFGCLSTTDWTTFNTKLGSYNAFTNPTATSFATTSGMVITNASSTINGNLNILGSATATNATTTTFYNSGQTRLGALSSSLVLSGSTGILSNFAGSSCTNQSVTALSAAGAATCTTLTSSYLDMTASYTWTGTQIFNGSLQIPQGAAPTVDAIGETALDTTANQLLIATSTNASFPAVFPLEQPLFSVTIGSTTPEFISSGSIPISRWVGKAREVTRVECYVSGGTSKVVNITDGTNDTETTTCGTTNTQDNSLDTNSTFTASELWYIEFGATSGAVNYVTYTAYGYVNRE